MNERRHGMCRRIFVWGYAFWARRCAGGGLAREAGGAYGGGMSAAEIIEMIKKLPPQEQAEVVAFARELDEAGEGRKVRYISDEKFAEVAPKVFEKHRELLRRLAQ